VTNTAMFIFEVIHLHLAGVKFGIF